MDIGYLKSVKRRLGMTTEELSKKSGIPIGTLNKIFAGQTFDPKFGTVTAVCKALGVSIADLEICENSTDRVTVSVVCDPETIEFAKLFEQLNSYNKGVIIGRIESLLERQDEACKER